MMQTEHSSSIVTNNNKHEIDINDFSAQLNDNIEWREQEIRDLEECLLSDKTLIDTPLYDARRKSLWVMLYAHYEGFFKFAFECYATEINKQKINCGIAHPMIATWSLDRIFHDLEQAQSKDIFFKDLLPDDAALHRIARRYRVVSELRTLNERIVEIPTAAYSTKSNLDYTRLQQLMYQAGFEHTRFSKYDDKKQGQEGGKIRTLVKYRNQIAHTAKGERLTSSEYEKVKQYVFDVMKEFTIVLVDACESQAFLAKK